MSNKAGKIQKISSKIGFKFVQQLTNVHLTVEVTKPRSGYLYIFDREMFPIGLTFIIGKITIEAEVTSDYYVERVDFYIDGQLKKSDYVEPYTCLLEDTLSFLHTIKGLSLIHI